MVLDFLNIFMVMASGIAIMLGIYLLLLKQNRLPNKILGLTMFFFALDLLNVVIYNTGYYKQHPHLTAVTAVFPFSYGPFLYMFARSVSEKLERMKVRDYLHFLPFVALTILGFPLYFLKDAEFKLAMAAGTADAPVLAFIGLFIPVAGIIYVILSAKVLRKYQERIKQSYSNIDQINMEWLRYYIIGNGVVWGFVVLSYLVNPFFPDWFTSNLLIYLPVSGFIWWISYISLSKQSSYLVNSAEVADIASPPAYSKSGLTDETARGIIEKLESLIAKEKPYRESTLKLQDLSDALNVAPHHLTEILNTRLMQSFYDYINSFRVVEVKQLIENDREKKFNLLTLALEAGFSSKSSFNSIFKKHTGETPSEYRTRVANQKAA